MSIEFFYNDTYTVSLPKGHRFPMDKYRLLREKLFQEKILSQDQLTESPLITESELYLAHDKAYVESVINLTLDAKSAKRIGLPLTPEMVTRSLASIGGSVAAANVALAHGVSAALSSGTHHALTNNGEGFCFFNDFAVIARLHKDKKILIIDLDVHQGNGNGEILQNDSHVTIVDFYCKNNYPLKKQVSPRGKSLGLASGTGDDEYLSLLAATLNEMEANYDLVLYQAGVDVLAGDMFGNFELTHDGVGQRDQLVFEWAKKNSSALSFVVGGGYSQNIQHTVNANFQTFVVAKEVYNF